MAKPKIIIRSQSRVGKTITVSFAVIGAVTAVTAALPAAATPNGATSQAASSVTLNAAGEGVKTWSALGYGDYAPAILTATNDEGVDTATTWPMHLFAPGTAPPGTPRVFFPDFTPPAFTNAAIAIGSPVTTFTLESTAASAQTNVPFTFGHAFKSGDLAPGDFLVGKIAGQADVALQLNVKATHPNGSVRHAIVSGVLPSLPAGASRVVSMVRSSAGTSTIALASSQSTNAGFSALVNLTIDGVLYTADATPVLAAGIASEQAWIAGAIANEYSVYLPIKTAAGVEHADLTAQFNVRHYQGSGAVKVDVTIEHTKAYTAVSDISYTGEVRVGGASVMTIAASGGGPLVHYPTSRWKRSFWWTHANPVHVRHNVAYLIATKQIWNYDQSVTIPETVLAGYATLLNDPKFVPMGPGLIGEKFGAQGGRPEIGPLPSWYAAALLSQDRRAKALMLAVADHAASFNNAHRRDTSTGPSGGQPLDVIHFPGSTLLGTSSDSKNGETGQIEKLPVLTTTSNMQPDASHQPSMSYLPYLLTGDLFYLEEMHFWCNFNVYANNPGYRAYEKGLLYPDQPRGQAWSMRTMAQCAAVTPDNYHSKPFFNYWLGNSLDWYNGTFTDNPSANKLGIMTQAALVYPKPHSGSNVKRAIGNFQDDFFTTSISHVSELGFPKATRLLMWKAKWQVSRIIGAGACWIDSCYYSPTVRDDEASPLYETIEQVMNATLTDAARALPCDTVERFLQIEKDEGRISTAADWKKGELGSYPTWGLGAAAQYQPALAAAVDVGYPGADDAWLVYDSRSNEQLWGDVANFAIVPRGYTAPPPPSDPTPDPDPIPDPPPTDNITYMAIADNVKDSTTTTGTGPFALAGAPQMNFRQWLTPPIAIGERTPYAAKHRTLPEWENGWGTLTAALVLERTEVTASSNNNQLVNFSAGTKDVSCDVTAAFVDTLAGTHNMTVDVISTDPTTTLLLVEQDGELMKVALSDAGQTFMQMPLLPGSAILDTDMLWVARDGVDYRAPRSYLGNSAPVDSTAPVLSSQSGTSTGSTSATGSVFTNEGNGILYCLASTSSTATATSIKAGPSQLVNSSGTQTFAVTGLIASTTYYLHFLHRDAANNDSAIATSTPFTTGATADSTAPVLSTPTGTQTGSTTATATVSTNEANGTLYCMVTTVAAPTAAQIKGALSQTITSTGVKTFNAVSLAPSTVYYAHFLHVDAANNESAISTSATFTTAAGDTTAPLLSTPSGTQTGSTTASGSVTTNEANGTLYCLISASSAPTAAQVKAGLSQAVTTTGAKTFSATGLTAATTYYASFLHRDAAGNDSAIATSASFATPAAADTTAPTLSSPTGTKTGTSTASGSVSTNEGNGTLYRMVSINPTETVAAIKAVNLTTTVTAAGVQNVTFTGLTGNTTYYTHFVHTDTAGNDSTVANSAALTTDPVAYTIVGYGSPATAVKTSYDATAIAATGSNLKGFVDGVQAGSAGNYWQYSPVPAGAKAGWSTSSTTPPPEITSTQNAPGGINGLQTAAKTGANVFPSGGYCWVPSTGGPHPMFFWHKPNDGVAQCLNPKDGNGNFIPLMVTVQ